MKGKKRGLVFFVGLLSSLLLAHGLPEFSNHYQKKQTLQAQAKSLSPVGGVTFDLEKLSAPSMLFDGAFGASGALHFDGESGLAVDLAPYVNKDKDFTLVFWFSLDNFNRPQAHQLANLFWIGDGQKNSQSLWVDTKRHSLHFSAFKLGVNSAAQSLSLNQAHHFTAAFRAKDEEFFLYLDGQKLGPVSYRKTKEVAPKVLLLGFGKGPATGFQGWLGNFSIFPDILTPFQTLNQQENPSPGHTLLWMRAKAERVAQWAILGVGLFGLLGLLHFEGQRIIASLGNLTYEMITLSCQNLLKLAALLTATALIFFIL